MKLSNIVKIFVFSIGFIGISSVAFPKNKQKFDVNKPYVAVDHFAPPTQEELDKFDKGWKSRSQIVDEKFDPDQYLNKKKHDFSDFDDVKDNRIECTRILQSANLYNDSNLSQCITSREKYYRISIPKNEVSRLNLSHQANFFLQNDIYLHCYSLVDDYPKEDFEKLRKTSLNCYTSTDGFRPISEYYKIEQARVSEMRFQNKISDIMDSIGIFLVIYAFGFAFNLALSLSLFVAILDFRYGISPVMRRRSKNLEKINANLSKIGLHAPVFCSDILSIEHATTPLFKIKKFFTWALIVSSLSWIGTIVTAKRLFVLIAKNGLFRKLKTDLGFIPDPVAKTAWYRLTNDITLSRSDVELLTKTLSSKAA